MKPIWIADDDRSIRWVLERTLARENLFSRSFTNVHDALNALDERTPQVLISDVRIPGGSGLGLLQAIKAKHSGLPVIIMAARSGLDSAVATFQGGAFKYLAKPFDVGRAAKLTRRVLEESLREEEIDDRLSGAPEIPGQAPAMQDMFRAVGRLSQSDVTVLVTGKSGTGKEPVARALHKHNPRANGPFITLSTAVIPKDLLESELLDHERDAFTGAQTMRRGCFEQVEDGTLFLDEVGDMPFDPQTRLLRVLLDGHFYHVGGRSPLRASMHAIAVTHQNLETHVRDGLFRKDLFYRLNTIHPRLPALRERSEGITLLARHFLQKGTKELGVGSKRISDDALAHIVMLPSPGNVRQLENLCNQPTVMAPTQTIESKDLLADLVRGNAQMLPVMDETTVRPAFIGKPSHGGEPYGVTSSVSTLLSSSAAGVSVAAGWERALAGEAKAMLEAGQPDVMDALTRHFERTILEAVLGVTYRRRVGATTHLGIGRNTVTRKLQELGFD